MGGFCMSGAATRIRARVRVRSPSQHYKKSASFIRPQDKLNELSFSSSCLQAAESESTTGNRVMVVLDSTAEARVALEWALSHTLQTHDTIILLHVPKHGEGEDGSTNYDLLRSTKNMCQQKRPEVRVEVAVAAGEGKDKGAAIVEEARRLSVSLLVLGQRKQSFLRRLQMIWASKRSRRSRYVDYCVQNANCMTIAVRRKNRKYGGYLITTKRHKNFWLLA